MIADTHMMNTTPMLTRYKWNLDDYHRLVEAGLLADQSVELLEGEVVEMAPEGTYHAAYSQDFADYLRMLLGDRAKIREAKQITLPNNSEPEPDIAIVAPHPLETYLQHHPYPEDIFWLIEYSESSLSKDLQIKSGIYASAGIAEYWVVNLKTRKLIVFREPEGSEYQQRQTLSMGTVSPIAFPDVAIALNRLV
jgi:Uma2 family endonuclease